LLPEYACIEHKGSLYKTTDVDIPDLGSDRVHDAMVFQRELAEARAKCKQSYALHPIGGFKQRTWTTARLTASGVEGRFEIQAQDERGDGTVPRLSFTPPDVSP